MGERDVLVIICLKGFRVIEVSLGVGLMHRLIECARKSVFKSRADKDLQARGVAPPEMGLID